MKDEFGAPLSVIPDFQEAPLPVFVDGPPDVPKPLPDSPPRVQQEGRESVTFVPDDRVTSLDRGTPSPTIEQVDMPSPHM